jgi:lipoprotein-anchoring transpeptidase ErfK/SrfK
VITTPLPAAALIAAAFVVLSLTAGATTTSTSVSPHSAATLEQPRAVLPTYIQPTQAQLVTLPVASYNAIIPSLIDAASIANNKIPVVSYTLTSDLTPVYGADRYGTPIAVLPRLNFTGEPTVVVPVGTAIGGFTEVMTPSRNAQPSQQGGHAASQTMGWLRTGDLGTATALPVHLLISVGQHTLKIVNTATGAVQRTFSIGVGRSGTDTPRGLTTYIQARYVDPKQAAGMPINLTGAHSAVSDHPYGSDQGLIAAHFEPNHTGSVSHGCIRLDLSGSNATAQLPLGTPILITE